MNLNIKVTKILYHRFLLLDQFHFCETHFTTYQRFVANKSAPFLGQKRMGGHSHGYPKGMKAEQKKKRIVQFFDTTNQYWSLRWPNAQTTALKFKSKIKGRRSVVQARQRSFKQVKESLTQWRLTASYTTCSQDSRPGVYGYKRDEHANMSTLFNSWTPIENLGPRLNIEPRT
jgi:hypothetical protein